MTDGVDALEPLVAQLAQIARDQLDRTVVERRTPEEHLIQHHRPMPRLDELTAQDHPDVSGPAGHEHAHAPSCVAHGHTACPQRTRRRAPAAATRQARSHTATTSRGAAPRLDGPCERACAGWAEAM